MAETSAKKEACGKCGADIRPDTQFCYSCGTALSDKSLIPEKESASVAVEKSTEAKPISSVWFQDRLDLETDLPKKIDASKSEQPTGVADEIQEQPSNVIAEDAPKESSEAESSKVTTIAVKSANAPAQRELQSAASLRKKSRAVRKQVIEIDWGEPSVSSGVWFLVAGIVAAVFAVGLLISMLVIR